MVDISLYFHFPFCTRKCPYCHFYTVPDRNHGPFLKAILKEWEIRFPEIEGNRTVSLYFGGGTPSLFPEGIAAILERVQAPEITVEANPEEITRENIETLFHLGVNRLSIGVQSFDTTLLKHLGRTHSAEKGREAVEIAHSVGMKNISIDLMYELPYQTLKSWKNTVHQACSLPITHLSLYNLTIEPHTLFKKREKELLPHLPHEKTATYMLQTAIDFFEAQGLKRYEISAFARNSQQSVHNTGYWTARPFIGFGPSAFSDFKGKRFQNVCDLKRYIKLLEEGLLPVGFEETLPPLKSLHERLAIALRLTEGISLPILPLSTHQLLQKLDREGWLVYHNHHAKLTEKGTLFYDTVAEQIIL